jgi:hypothetical protein
VGVRSVASGGQDYLFLVLGECHTLKINPKDDHYLNNIHHGNLKTSFRTNCSVKQNMIAVSKHV